MTLFLGVIALFIIAAFGVDVLKNPESYRNLSLRIGDGCRYLWFWPLNLRAAYSYSSTAKHRKKDAGLPPYMKSWRMR